MGKKTHDWVTYCLIAMAGIVIALIWLKLFNNNNTPIPPYKNIIGWDSLLTTDSPREGQIDAPIKIVIFYTYSCGFCNILHDSINELQQNYPREIVIFYRPVHMGNYGLDYFTASAAHCAYRDGSFKLVHNRLYEFQRIVPSWEKLADQANVKDQENFLQCIEERQFNSIIQRDEKVFDSLGGRGVPFIVINGKGFLGSLGYTHLERIVERELKQ